MSQRQNSDAPWVQSYVELSAKLDLEWDRLRRRSPAKLIVTLLNELPESACFVARWLRGREQNDEVRAIAGSLCESIIGMPVDHDAGVMLDLWRELHRLRPSDPRVTNRFKSGRSAMTRIMDERLAGKSKLGPDDLVALRLSNEAIVLTLQRIAKIASKGGVRRRLSNLDRAMPGLLQWLTLDDWLLAAEVLLRIARTPLRQVALRWLATSCSPSAPGTFPRLHRLRRLVKIKPSFAWATPALVRTFANQYADSPMIADACRSMSA